jgi:hypothetical protein
VIQEYLDSARVQPKQSLSSQLYNEGLTFFYEAFYNKALRKFEEVEKLNSNYPRLNYYEALCHDKIDAGEDKESFMQKNFFRIMALILFTGGIYIFYRWQKKKRETFHA